MSDINKVAIAAFGALLIVVFNSAYGVINARKQRVMAAKVMGASRWQIFKDVLVWESLQPNFVGLRSAVSMALVIVIVAEMFIGSDNGLGHRIIDAQQVLNVKTMYAAILAAGILGYGLNICSCWSRRASSTGAGRMSSDVRQRRPDAGDRRAASSAAAPEPDIEVRGLTKNFAGAQLYDRTSTWTSRSGEFISIFGPNGCGKSTLINLISGMVPIDSGTVRFNGKPMTETLAFRLRFPELP